MKNQNMHRLDKLQDNNYRQLLSGGLKGIEKESLRISGEGCIAKTPHPSALGAALTHPYITTDYSEALLEFITPPFANIKDTLAFMQNIHLFVYDNLDDELLLSASMPCGIKGDESIPIARYGSSNIGKMKHIYRRGLSYRYGRTMQSIAGIHFNYSVPDQLWPVLQQLEHNPRPLEQFISDAYFGLIRNFQRQGWIILYLFGASPAICKSFFKSRPALMNHFDEFDKHTLYHPYATSLRMSDIGYKSSNQANLEIDYNTLDGYVASLCQAIETPFPDYARIGVKVDGEYRQLNSNALQIENEYYSTVRPKQIANSCEKPTFALKKRGVRYVEIRSLDLDLNNPVGISESNSRFIEALLLTCLLQDSPANSPQEQSVNNDNQLAVAHQGRKPGLELQNGHDHIPLTEWAQQILSNIQPVCEILDGTDESRPYTNALLEQQQRVEKPELTPSARILEGMQQKDQPFAPYALQISAGHKDFFTNIHLDEKEALLFKKYSEESFAKQKKIEANDQYSFDEFLNTYFSQTCS